MFGRRLTVCVSMSLLLAACNDSLTDATGVGSITVTATFAPVPAAEPVHETPEISSPERPRLGQRAATPPVPVAPVGGDEKTIRGFSADRPVLTRRAGRSAQPPVLDAVVVQLTGPVNQTVNLTLNNGAFEGTITDLPAGRYSVEVIGRGNGLVTYYGVNGSVTVQAGQNTDAPITLTEYEPRLDPFTSPTANFAFDATWLPIAGATEYLVEASFDAGFASVTSFSTTNTSFTLQTNGLGTVYVRVRAGNAAFPATDGSPSNVESVDVVGDQFATGDDMATAPSLGTAGDATGYYIGRNITNGDEDWFALDLWEGSNVTIEVFAALASVVSPLDPHLRLYDSGGGLVAENNDFNAPTLLDSRLTFFEIPADDTYFIQITGVAGSVGHYELGVAVSDPSTADLGNKHGCALSDTGEIYCWGDNTWGQIGPTAGATDAPTLVDNFAYVAMTTGRNHSCAIDIFFDAYCWGNGNEGKLGNGEFAHYTTPQLVAGGHLFIDIAAGFFHTCGLTVNNEVYCWGFNALGQLGDATQNASSVPVLTSGTREYEDVAAGGSTSCALEVGGNGWCWGDGNDGQLGSGFSTASFPTQIASQGGAFRRIEVGYEHACGVGTANDARCWGAGSFGALGDGSGLGGPTLRTVSGGVLWERVVPGRDFTCGTSTSGVGYCWGLNDIGQVGNGTSTASHLTPQTVAPIGVAVNSMAAGEIAACLVSANQEMFCWGADDYGMLAQGGGQIHLTGHPVAGLSNIVDLSVGTRSGCAIVSGGAGTCWGFGTSGQLGNNSTNSSGFAVGLSGGLSFAQISVGAETACGVTGTGAGYCWGYGFDGQIGNGANADQSVPTAVAGGHTFQEIRVGAGGHVCGLTTVADLYCWGRNSDGQLGDGTTTDSNLPVFVDNGYKTFDVGADATCAIWADDIVECWGANWAGQLGNGSTTSSSVPGQAGDSTFATISGEGWHFCGVLTGGDVQCWGANFFTQIDASGGDVLSPVFIPGNTTLTSVSAGALSTCGLTGTGTAYCWGFNGFGQLGTGTVEQRDMPTPTAGNATYSSISVGYSDTCGLTTGNQVRCWGNPRDGAMGRGNDWVRQVPTKVFGTVVFAAPQP